MDLETTFPILPPPHFGSPNQVPTYKMVLLLLPHQTKGNPLLTLLLLLLWQKGTKGNTRIYYKDKTKVFLPKRKIHSSPPIQSYHFLHHGSQNERSLELAPKGTPIYQSLSQPLVLNYPYRLDMDPWDCDEDILKILRYVI